MLITLTLIQIVGIVLCGILLLFFSGSSLPGLGGFTKTSNSIVIPITVDDYKLLADMTVGTAKPGRKDQVLRTYFNVFSTLSWAHSMDMCRTRNCDLEPFKPFDGSKSNTYKRTKSVFEFKGDLNNFAGVISQDQFKYGSQEGLWATFQFLELTEKSDLYEGYDVTLGLNLNADNMFGHQTAVMGMLAQMVEPVFGIYFHKTPQNDEHGNLVVGGKDGGFMEGPLKQHDVLLTDKGRMLGWTIKIDKVVLIYKDGTRKEKELSVKVAAPAPGLDDIILPAADSRKVLDMAFERVSFQHDARTFLCNTDWRSLPKIALVLSGEEYILSPEDYVRPTSNKPKICVAAIGEYPSKILLGRPFMKKYYTRFHIGKKQLQFAAAKQPLIREKKP